MANRNLVDIFPSNYRNLQRLRAECKKHKVLAIPTIPQLVNHAVEKQMASLYLTFIPTKDERQEKVSKG